MPHFQESLTLMAERILFISPHWSPSDNSDGTASGPDLTVVFAEIDFSSLETQLAKVDQSRCVTELESLLWWCIIAITKEENKRGKSGTYSKVVYLGAGGGGGIQLLTKVQKR